MKKQARTIQKRVIAILLAAVMVVQGIGMAPLVARADEVTMNENTSFDTAEELIMDTTTAVDIGMDEYLYYQFTPSETGYYTFYSEGDDIDPEANLYNSDEESLVYSDDDGDNLNFSASYNLEEGQKYYLIVNLLSDDGGSLTIHVKKTTFYAKAEQSDVTIKYGETGVLSVNAYTDSGTLSYQWYSYDVEQDDYILIENWNSNSYTVDSSVNKTTRYYCMVSDGEDSDEVFFYITLDTGLKLEDDEVNVTIPYGGKGTLAVEASGGMGELNYEWYYYDSTEDSYVRIENATGSSCEVEGTLDMPSEYECVVTDGITTMSCYFYPMLDTGLELEKTYIGLSMIYGETKTVVVEATGGVGELTYQWYAYDKETEEYVPIEGANESSYELTATVDKPRWYRCDVTDGIVTKECEVGLDIATGLTLETSGDIQVIPEGATRTLSVKASGMLDDFTYQWYAYDEDGEGYISIEGATESTYSVIGDAMAAKRYMVDVSDGVSESWTYIQVTVVPVVEFDLEGKNTLSSESFETMKEVVYKITPEEDGAYYFYSESTEGGNPYARLWDGESREVAYSDNATDYEFGLSYYLKKGETYYLVIGTTETVASYTIQAEKTDFTAAAKGENEVSLSVGETKTLEVEAYNETGTLSYQWGYYNENNQWIDMNNATQSSLEITGSEETLPYYFCKVTDGNKSTEVIFRVTLATKLAAISDYDGVVLYGEKTTLSVLTTGGVGTISYQWYYMQDDQWIPIENATASSYEVSGVKDVPLEYYCQVSDGHANASAWFYLEMDTGLEVTSNSGVYCREYGDKITFYARATGGVGSIGYQWYYYVDDEEEYRAIDGATGSDLICIARGDVAYRCDVTDGVVTRECYFDVYLEDSESVVELTTVAEAELEYTAVTYDGTAKTPKITVKDNGVTLYAGKDYTVEYTDNTNIGTATVTITGIGDYTGNITKKFAIEAISLSDATVTLDTTSYTYDGTAKTPVVTVKHGNKVLANGTDYTVTYSDNTNVGTATVTVSGMGIYKGTITKEFAIKEPENKEPENKEPENKPVSISEAVVSLEKNSYNYDGKAKTPAVTVQVGNDVLAKDTDYTVSYANNTNIGTATVTITGKGNYTGTASATFQIKVKKGSRFTIGAYKYEITGSNTVAFAGIKSNKTKKVNIAKTVEIGGMTFKVTSIANKALYKKSKVTSVTIGANVTKIGKEAFRSCSKLKTVTIKSQKLKTVGKNAFKGIKSTATIKVPSKKLKAYKKLLKGKGQSSKVKIKK